MYYNLGGAPHSGPQFLHTAVGLWKPVHASEPLDVIHIINLFLQTNGP